MNNNPFAFFLIKDNKIGQRLRNLTHNKKSYNVIVKITTYTYSFLKKRNGENHE